MKNSNWQILRQSIEYVKKNSNSSVLLRTDFGKMWLAQP